MSSVVSSDKANTVWQGVIERYRKYLPVTNQTPVVSLNEGNTPLLHVPNFVEAIGGQFELYLKYEGLNPTCSFKDRGMTMAVSLIPNGKIALGKLAQALMYGATTIAIDGNFDQALKIVIELGETGPVEVVNSVNPVRIEGQKTASFEICDYLGDAPDFHFLPVGNAGNITAYWKGFKEYHNAAESTKLPRLFGWQAAGAAPIVDGAPVAQPRTVATAIRIGNPASWEGATNAAKESDGQIGKVTDEEILEAYKLIARTEGVFVEPACAAPLAGLAKSVKAGAIPEGSVVTATMTGHGLKDPDTAVKTAGFEPTVVPAEKEAVMRVIGL
jgi:threonine synthase